MSPSYNGWQDDPEDEREALGQLDEFEGWPEETAGPEYWLNRRALEDGEI